MDKQSTGTIAVDVHYLFLYVNILIVGMKVVLLGKVRYF